MPPYLLSDRCERSAFVFCACSHSNFNCPKFNISPKTYREAKQNWRRLYLTTLGMEILILLPTGLSVPMIGATALGFRKSNACFPESGKQNSGKSSRIAYAGSSDIRNRASFSAVAKNISYSSSNFRFVCKTGAISVMACSC